MPRDGFNFRSRGAFSQPISQLRNEGGLRNGTRVAMRCFAERVHEAVKSFRSQGAISQWRLDFAAASWGYEIISQPRAIFAGASFGLRNFADHEFFLAFELLLTPRDLPSISLQFLLNKIIQKD